MCVCVHVRVCVPVLFQTLNYFNTKTRLLRERFQIELIQPSLRTNFLMTKFHRLEIIIVFF